MASSMVGMHISYIWEKRHSKSHQLEGLLNTWSNHMIFRFGKMALFLQYWQRKSVSYQDFPESDTTPMILYFLHILLRRWLFHGTCHSSYYPAHSKNIEQYYYLYCMVIMTNLHNNYCIHTIHVLKQVTPKRNTKVNFYIGDVFIQDKSQNNDFELDWNNYHIYI